MISCDIQDLTTCLLLPLLCITDLVNTTLAAGACNLCQDLLGFHISIGRISSTFLTSIQNVGISTATNTNILAMHCKILSSKMRGPTKYILKSDMYVLKYYFIQMIIYSLFHEL